MTENSTNVSRTPAVSTAKWKIDLAKIAATGTVAAVAAVIASALTYLAAIYDSNGRQLIAKLQNDTAVKEINLKMIDLSLDILAGEKGGANERENAGYVLSRDFAIRALSKASEIEISDKDRAAWAAAEAIQLRSAGAVNENTSIDTFVFDDANKSRLRVCIGEFFSGCSEGVRNHFTCGTSLDDVAAMACPAGAKLTLTLNRGGNRCGYATYNVECNT